MNKHSINTFEKGLFLDSNPGGQPQGTYSFAYNAVNRDHNQLVELSNEHANQLAVDLGSQIVGWGYIDEKDKFVVFTHNGLFLVDIKTNEKQLIANGDEFGCDWNLDGCEWITPQFKTVDPCAETIVYWSSGCEYFKVNIDEMLDSTRKQSIKDSMKPQRAQCSDITCEYFKVFKLTCPPKLTPIAYNKGGGSLLAGAYQFVVRLLNNEGGETNWFTISNPVYVGGENNQPGEITEGLIEIHFNNLDCNFDFGELAVIKTIGGITTTHFVTRFNYVNGNYSYSYMGNDDQPIDLEEILTKGKTYLQGHDLLQYNGNMLYFNIKQDKNLNFQKRVIEEVKTNWIRYRTPYQLSSQYNLKSYMRGETYGFGVKYNSADGRSTRVFHIAPQGSSGGGGSAIGGIKTPSAIGIIGVRQQGTYERSRTPKSTESVSDLQLDQHDIELREDVGSFTTNTSHLCTGASDCEECATAASQCNTDAPIVEEVFGDMGAILSGLGGNGSDDTTVDYNINTLQDAADALAESVENRERTTIIPRTITVYKGTVVSMDSSSTEITGNYGGSYVDINGDSQIELVVERTPLGASIVKEEEDILYPDTKDCSGEYIYGSLANQPVRHHQVPWTSVVPHYISNSLGVPSKATPDADEYKDAFVDIIGVQFTDIPIPTEEELGFKLCESNPYTIVQIPRTSKNKTIHSKGIITSTLLSSNEGKDYLYPTHGVNSVDSIVNRYINKDDSRRDPNAVWAEHYNYWSLDTMVKAHALNVNKVRREGIVSGIGYRHGQAEVGNEPADSMYGSRIDQRGTRQAVNLHKFDADPKEEDLQYKIYAPANEVISAPSGAPASLMNKYQQESVWFGAPLGTLKDASFKGDVLEHDAPISDAKAYYVALLRDLPNQYGDLTNMPYIPILEGSGTSVEGICGDTFIGPHSFVRTSYVSDKVGNKFPISNMVPGKADRCICDSPEDATHSYVGKWVPSTLPKDGDAADAKNWAGLHTDSVSHNWTTANGRLPVSDYYYNKVVKTMITYWGEFEVNPHMRQRGDALEEQVYNRIKPKYGLDSTINSASGEGWDKDYLNQFYYEVQQPSKWKILKKTLIRSLIVLLAPAIGITEMLTPETAFEFIGELGSAGILISMWAAVAKVLFTNKYLDELLGIPVCRMDEEGGEKDSFIKGFFQNYNKYNSDFSLQNRLEVFFGLPVPYYTCDCDECEDKSTGEVFISDEQKPGSQLDAYTVVRPNNWINIPPSFGGITDLFINGSNLYAHTTNQIIPLRYGQTSIPSNVGDIILGPGPIFAKPVGTSEGASEGFAGLLSRQHAINTQYGRFFIDYKASKLYKFQGQLTDITGPGVYSHFRNKLHYCEVGECENEHINPNDLALGLDPRLERLLLTKRAIDDSQSWTLSYDIQKGQWVSFHDYKPNFYMWDRYSMITGNDTQLWNHNNTNKFQTYMGKYSPYIIEFVIDDKDMIKEVFKGGHLDTYAVKGDLRNREVTFNKAWFRNDEQSSGIVELIPVTTKNCLKEDKDLLDSEIPQIRLIKNNGSWNYHGVYDLTNDLDAPTQISTPCAIDVIPVNLKSCSDSTTFNNTIHLNNSLVVRFIFDNFDDYKLYTRHHMSANEKKIEYPR